MKQQLLADVGDKGRHQILLYWIFVLPINFLIPWLVLVPIFMTSTPTHWCHVPGRPPNVSVDQWKQLTVPKELKEGKEVFSSCSQYNITGDFLQLLDLTATAGDASDLNTSYSVVGCQAGWEYDHTDYDLTLTMELDWVCEKDSLVANWRSAGVAGNVVGTLVLNSLSDILGRRPIVVVAAMIYAVFGLVRLYVRSYEWLMVTMFLASTSFPPILELSLIIVLEQVSPGWRTRITSTSFIFWTVGMSLLPLLAWLTRNWVLLGVVTTVPFYVFILCWWILPESPRWLLSRDRIEQCTELMKTIAKRNGKAVPEKLTDTLKAESLIHNTVRNYGVLQLFKYPTVRLRTFLLTVCYTSNNLFYYGLAYNTANMSGNEFLNFFLLSVTELPANLLGWWSADFLGRRWTAAGAMLLAAVFSLVNVFFLDASQWVTISLMVVSKMFITISFMVVYVQCAEVYPTTHRSCGTGLSSLISSIFGTAAPYIAYSNVYGAWLPYLIIFFIGCFGCLNASLLPETLNVDLPQSLIDAESFLTSEKFWSYKGKRLWSRKVQVKQNNVAQGHVNLANSESTLTI
ncbi:carcinine transporter isoform X2 [Procambarus clarkii]|uniref:carcinine transporter isoform X2 n=1 Tax=Procambarus clarkii TaxID=6728 RepID=UPI003742E21E